ncbi:response regulator [Nocardioides convexus]|uniref:response regulator n=1 Tax=Nocardioides convexus TaxID=2712224 RepID=UPI0024187E69|nr:response regulator [Nocardioides convexus]
MSVRVLVVEDEALAAEAHASYVERVPGFALAGVARSAREAVRALETAEAAGEPVDLVLLDMHLPDGHGLGLLTALRGAGHLCDVIAVTAARDTKVVRQAVVQGVVLYLLKPFTFATFRAKAGAVRRVPRPPRRRPRRGGPGRGRPGSSARCAPPAARRCPRG